MGVKLKGGLNEFFTVFDKAEEIMADQIREGLAHLGEDCVAKIREKKIDEGSWHDRTTNLRSSIGYAVIDHGADVISSAFQALNGPNGNGSQGAEIGKRYVKELASQYSKVYALLVVAGMNYAEYVEARGYDVLSGTQLWAEQNIDKYLKVYVGRAERMIAGMIKKL